MTWIKICGTTNLEDALTAVKAGADALGFVFYEDSPRNVDAREVRGIVARLPERIEKVGVFVDRPSDEMLEIAAKAGLTAAQLLVSEDPVVAEQMAEGTHPRFQQLWPRGRARLKILVAVSMQTSDALARVKEWNPKVVQSFLLDSGSAARPGGTGKTFDWRAGSAAAEQIASLGRVAVAGGLTAGNVGEAMRILKPWGVDVVSGVESAPGKKDPEKVRAFIAAVRQADKKT